MMSQKAKVLAIVATLLNLFDTCATLFMISKGATEVNPVMAHALEIGPEFFVAIKIVLFTFAIILIARRSPALLNWIVGGYGLLALWHCYLFSSFMI
tara:strand:- start:236 stop:526 length:291 start_codon:yes stop_codon:yes gene_type:complete